MPQSFVEYAEVDPSPTLRQGDVLEAVEVDPTGLGRLLLVITADCDLVLAKNRGLVTCVPILTKDEYLLGYAAPRIVETLLKKPLGELQMLLKESGFESVSETRLREWIEEVDDAAFLAELSVTEDRKTEAAVSIGAVRLLTAPKRSVSELIEALVAAQLASANPPASANARSKVLSKLREHFAHPPGDVLFLGSVAPGMDDGYFAYLRHLEQVPQGYIATIPSRTGVEYRRVSRLQDRFTHAIVQRFAMVFMSIGLPSEYEEIRDLHADLLGES